MNVWCMTTVFAFELYACYRYMRATSKDAGGFATLAVGCCLLLCTAPLING